MAPRVSCSRLASNPTLKHPGHLGVAALLSSRCNLPGTELALHVEAALPVCGGVVERQTFARRTDDTKNRSKVIALRNDISLVSTLFLSLQSRPDFDLDNFFKYENQKEPPSLSDQGKVRSGTKSDVLQCLTIPKLTPPDDVTVKVLDGPAVVHIVRPTYGTNYQPYVVRHFMPFITNSLTNSTPRLDIIWDIYPDHNLKAEAQAKRGNPGVTTIVEGSTPVPRDWNKFLANSRNNVQLFRYLSKAVTYDDHVLVNTTDSQSVADFDTIMPCNHQEADSRIFLHLSHAAQQGHSKAFIRTVDSDVVIIAVGHFGSLGVMELRIGFGTGKAFQHIPLHEITQTLGPEKSLSCRLFHSFTGCDTTSSFLGIGKKTAWAAWQAYPDFTKTLLTLSDYPTLLTLDSIHMARLERWTVVMYSKSSGCSRVNDVRRQLFIHGTRTLDHTPPPHTGSAASTCKASSVPGRLHLEITKAATPRCPGCFSVGLDARREHETLGAILDCSR